MRLSGPTDEELISNAASVINPKVVGDRLFGDVGRAPTTRDGNLYLLGKDKVSKLEDLLPSRECPEPLAWLSRGRCRWRGPESFDGSSSAKNPSMGKMGARGAKMRWEK